MRILGIRALRGPNYWSIRRHKLIVMELDLEDYEEKPSNKIPGFLGRAKALMPSLHEHRCSYGVEGGFLRRVKEGTWAGHIIEHFALEIQTLAGMDTGFGRTRETSTPGVYNVVFSYIEEDAGYYAAEAAVDIYLALAENLSKEKTQEKLANHIQKLREIREDVRFGPSTASIVDEAYSRNIPYIRLNEYSLVQLGYGIHQQRIQATTTGRTNMIAVELACDKYESKKILEGMGIPVPRGYEIRDKSEIKETIEALGFPLAVKPLDANHGKGITVNLTSSKEVKTAFDAAKKYCSTVIVEQSLVGSDFRALVVNNKLVAVAERRPAHVIGDGKHTIQELIDIVNKDPRRGYGHEKVLTQIEVDHQTQRLLKFKNYALETILPKGEICYLKSTANLSTGGTAIDLTDDVHPYNVFLFERIARIIGLDIAGIDVVAPNVFTPITENGGGVVEVNAAPGFRMHLAPSEGIGRNVAEHVVDMLFPPGTSSRIPIIAVTGTNGKTTTTRLIAHILKSVARTIGFTTSDGIYIGNRLIESGDTTGPVSAKMVLKDPTVEIAVLEVARGGMLRAGLGFDHCDIGVVTNVAEDHLGLRNIDTVEDLARVKSIVPCSVHKDGFAILNADDDLVYKMKSEVDCQVALFSMIEKNPRILRHAKKGGICCIYENGYITILKGQWKIRIEKVINIPLTFAGKATFMIQNVLAASLTAFLRGVKNDDIRYGLTTFVPNKAQAPGRLNLFEMGEFSVLIDFAHNPAGLEALGKFIERLPGDIKTGVLGGTGDRRDEDTRQLGRIAAGIFTQIIAREDDNKRGRKEGEVNKILVKGIREVNPNLPIKEIISASEAVEYALNNAQPGELVVILADEVARTVKIVSQFRERLNPVNVREKDIPNL